MHICLLGGIVLLAAAPPSPAAQAPAELSSPALREEVEAAFLRNDLDAWFPRCVDSVHGGFIASYDEDWNARAKQSKFLVFQARMTWLAARASEHATGQRAETLRQTARHGLNFLARTQWDQRQGGFFWNLTQDGRLPDGDTGEKDAYGISFAIYAAAAVAHATGDPTALKLAQWAFRWLDEHGHDPVNGGYREAFSRNGTPLLSAPAGRLTDLLGTPYGYKSMNTHIHLLESFTALYVVWPDPLLRSRLDELFHLVRDRMFVSPGCLFQYYDSGFHPIPAPDSYGHDIETAYLLSEAAAALDIPDDPRTWQVGRALVDHTLERAWDTNLGGFVGEGPVFGIPSDRTKIWWVQAEALNTLLLFHERYGRDDARYGEAFLREWRFIQTCQLDAKQGGWYAVLAADGHPLETDKGGNWKCSYHTGRALLNIAERLARQETVTLKK